MQGGAPELPRCAAPGWISCGVLAAGLKFNQTCSTIASAQLWCQVCLCEMRIADAEMHAIRVGWWCWPLSAASTLYCPCLVTLFSVF
jgi:hypothetical protein